MLPCSFYKVIENIEPILKANVNQTEPIQSRESMNSTTRQDGKSTLTSDNMQTTHVKQKDISTQPISPSVTKEILPLLKLSKESLLSEVVVTKNLSPDKYLMKPDMKLGKVYHYS